RLQALDLLNEVGGGLRYLASELVYDQRVRRLLRRAERLLVHNELTHEWIVYLGLLLAGLSPQHLDAVLDRLFLANDEKDWIRAGVDLTQQLERSADGQALARSQIYHRLHGHSDQSLAIAACLAPPPSPVRRSIRLYLDELRNVKVSTSGNDLLKLGFPR